MKNRVFGIGSEQYATSTVFSQQDMMMNFPPYNFNYNYYYPFYPNQMGGMENMMYPPNMAPNYYPNMRPSGHMGYMRQ